MIAPMRLVAAGLPEHGRAGHGGGHGGGDGGGHGDGDGGGHGDGDGGGLDGTAPELGAVDWHALGWIAFDVVVVVLLVAAALGYVLALRAARRRGSWPALRTVAWFAGLACAGAALLGPLAQAAHERFTAHMAAHLLLGMVAPLLLVLAAPVTIALRALPVRGARRLSRLLRTPWVRFVTHPVTAAVLNAGGLWLLYSTELYHLMHTSVAVHALVHAHLLLAGAVFTASIVGVDPDPHRAPMLVRSVVLIVFIAAHAILAKRLFAHPPAGVTSADAEAGSQLMYYGGDVVDVLLIVLLFAGWYARTRPRTSRPPQASARTLAERGRSAAGSLEPRSASAAAR